MTNYEHYQSTVEQVNRAIQKEANAPCILNTAPSPHPFVRRLI